MRRLLRVESKWPRRLKRAASSSGVMEAMGVLLAGMVVTQLSLLVRCVCCVLHAHKNGVVISWLMLMVEVLLVFVQGEYVCR